jgi:hypothetical protein
MSDLPPASFVSLKRHAANLPWLPILAVTAAIIAAWPLISQPGLVNTRGGGDSPFLLQRLQQLEVALRDGHFPVRWMPDANYGFGYPFYNFYAPLSIYVALLFRFLGSSYVHALELAQVAGFVVGAWGMYVLAQRWYRHQWAALLASVAYTTAPFHMVNIYVRGDSLAEFWAMALYPWVILTADRLFDPRGRGLPYGRVLAFALTYAALILSHNISALIFTPFLFLFLFLRWIGWWRAERRGGREVKLAGQIALLGPLLLAGLLAVALSAWFFVPALAEQDLAQLGPVTAGYFNYSNHFRGADLVQRSFTFDYDVSGGGAFSMGLVQAAAAAVGALTLISAAWRQKVVAPATALFILLTLAIATFMITPWSTVLWDHLPLLSFTQFPWRFLSVQAFAAALAIGALALLPFCRVVSISTAVLLLLSALSGLHTDQLLLDDADVTAERLAQYEWFTGNIGSTVSAEYLPPSVQPRVYTSAWLNDGTRDVVRALSGDVVEARLLERRTQQQQWQIEAGAQGATAVLPVMAWPGWSALLDGQPQRMTPAPGSGLVLIDIPAGEHTVILRLERTPVRLAAELFSLAGLLLALLLLYKARREVRFSRFAVGLAVLLLGLMLALRFWPAQPLRAGTLTWDFAQMGYLHHAQNGVPFSNGVRLLRYDYDRETVQAGETVTITVEFSGANNDVLTLALGSPALARPDVDPAAAPLTQMTRTLDKEMLQFELPVPADSPAGLMIPRLTFAVGRPLMASGQPRGDLFLRPLRVVDERPAPPDAADLDVQATGVTMRDPDTLDVRLAWNTARALSANYKASLLLLDETGAWLAQLDTQPGYGFLPSSEWSTRTAVDDQLALALSADVPEDTPLALVARLYAAENGQIDLTRRLGEVMLHEGDAAFVENEPLFELPRDVSPQTAVFDGRIRLHGTTLVREGDLLKLSLYWEALAPLDENVTRFVHLFDPQSEAILLQADGTPRGGSYPTSQWLPGEIVTDTIALDLSDVPPGDYALGAGFYQQVGETYPRLTAVDSVTGAAYPANRVTLEERISR